jgi:hypothetical protein
MACAICAIQARSRRARSILLVRGLILASGAALLCIALPLLGWRNPFHDVIGLFVFFIGLRIAWQLTAGPRHNLDGPYSTS